MGKKLKNYTNICYQFINVNCSTSREMVKIGKRKALESCLSYPCPRNNNEKCLMQTIVGAGMYTVLVR